MNNCVNKLKSLQIRYCFHCGRVTPLILHFIYDEHIFGRKSFLESRKHHPSDLSHQGDDVMGRA